MKTAEVVVLKGEDCFRLAEQARISPAPKLCGANDGFVRCLSVRRGSTVLTDIDRASRVVERRLENLPLMHRLWVHHSGFSLGYRKSAPIGHPSEVFFLDDNGRLLESRQLSDAISTVAAYPGAWYVGCRDGRVYAFVMDGELLWRRKLKVPALYSIPGMFLPAAAPRLELGVGRGLVGIGAGRQFWVFDSFGHEQWCAEVPRECAGREVVCGPREVPSRERLIGRLSLPAEVAADRVYAGFLRLEMDTAGGRSAEFLRTVEKYPWPEAGPQEGGVSDESAIEVVMAGFGSGSAIFSVGMAEQQIALGLMDGRLQVWDYERGPQESYRVGRDPVSVLMDNQELRASYAGGLLTRFAGGQITGCVKLPPHHVEMALCGTELVAWRGTDAWVVDETGRVVWRATFAKKIGGVTVHELGFEVLAGSLLCFQRTTGERRDGKATGEPGEGGEWSSK